MSKRCRAWSRYSAHRPGVQNNECKDAFRAGWEAAEVAKEMACPICGEKLTKFRCECTDGGWWLFGWLCGCTEESRQEVSND